MKKIALITLSAFAVIAAIFLFINMNEKYPLKNEGKYENYINYVIEQKNKNFVNNLMNNNLLYSNVIYEYEAKKDGLKYMEDNDILAEYLVCLVSEVNEYGTAIKYYNCKIPYVKYKNVLNDELAKIKDIDYNELLTNAAISAGTGAITGAGTGVVAVPGIGSIPGSVIGAIVGGGTSIISNIFEQGKNKKIKLNEFIEEFPEDNYIQSLTDFSSIMKPNIEQIAEEDLSKYLNNDKDIKLLNKTIRRYIY